MKLFKQLLVTQLNLNEQNQGDTTQLENRSLQLLGLCQTFLTLLYQYRWDIEEIKSRQFLQTIETWKEELSEQGDPTTLDRFHHKLYEKAAGYLGREKAYLEEREVELKQLISLLSDAVSTVSAGNGAYHQHLLETTTTISKISQLEDIRKVRSLLSSEVEKLKQTIKERQSQEREQFEKLSEQVNTLQQKLETAVTRSLRDPLTGLFNREGWDQELAKSFHMASISRKGFALGIADVDTFKEINDNSGHQVGDLVLQKLAKVFEESFRSEDVLARLGGDEFGFLLFTPSLEKARTRLESLCKQVAKPTYHCSVAGRDFYVKISISCGVSYYRQGDSPATIFERADNALYLAKKAGKRRVATEQELTVNSS